MMFRSDRHLTWIAMMAACSPVSTIPEPTPGMIAHVTSPTIELAGGGAQLVMASVTRLNGFDADIALVVDALPEGMRAESNGMETVDGMSSALIAVVASTNVVPGQYPVTVRAIGFGVPDASVGLTVVVSPAGTPVYTLEARPISVYAGASAIVRTSIDRGVNTKSRPITVLVTDVPNGVGVSLYPETNVAAITTMTVVAGPNVLPGQYAIKIRGVSVGLPDRVATIPLTVLHTP